MQTMAGTADYGSWDIALNREVRKKLALEQNKIVEPPKRGHIYTAMHKVKVKM